MSTRALKKAMSKDKKLTREERLQMTLKKKVNRQQERKELIDQLLTNSMTTEKRSLLKSSSTLGKKETNKESIERQKLEKDLHVENIVPMDTKYSKNVSLDKKVMRSENIPKVWEEVDSDEEWANQPSAPKKTADVKREEKSKKKYFFWSEDAMNRDFDEYGDVDQIQLEKDIKQKEVDKQQQQQEKEDGSSEDEKTVQLKGNTGKDRVIESTKEEEGVVDNKTNDTSLKRKDTAVAVVDEVVTESKKNKKEEEKIVKKQKVIKEEVKEETPVITDTATQVTSEVDRYTMTIDDFGKMEDETREYILSTPSGVEMLEQKIFEETKEMKAIKYNVFNVQVTRLPEVEASRENLPIMMEEHSIVEKIKENDIVIICGETGSGKTTQVPQFLYESGFGHPLSDFPGIIGVTQPRRVAAVATAKRVAHELNCVFGKEVGYQIRYDKKLDSSVNKIKFMTDGILLREVQTDFLLSQYSCIIIDEAHERNLNTDILIGLLSRIVPMRKKMFFECRANPALEKVSPLKIVIMSATLRVEDFTKNTNLFGSVPPVINIPTRQYPVTIHFNKKTVLENYVDEAYKKVAKIHKQLPPGGVLVFVTGRQEVEYLCAKLRRSYPVKALNKTFKMEMDNLTNEFKEVEELEDTKHNYYLYGDADSADNDQDRPQDGEDDQDSEDEEDYESIQVVNDSDIEVDDEEGEEDKEGEEEVEMAEKEEEEGEEEEEEEEDEEEEKEKSGDEKEGEEEDDDEEKEKPLGPLYVLPLYSQLPTVKQMRVFQTPPLGSRLVVVATNLAETSLTIPNIKYVVDAGRVKGRFYNKENGVSSFDVTWTSKASADQRAGRAGRTGPGHCYRIYSSAVYNDHFDQFSKPEILLIPIEGMVLQMKSMGIHNITRFPFPTPPEEVSLKMAIKSLIYLGALDKKLNNITDLGTQMSTFPLSPRFSKMLLLGRQQNCLEYIIAIVSILTVKNPFVVDNNDEDDAQTLKQLSSEEITEREMEQKEKEERQKTSQRIRNSQRKWMHKESDILTILKVVGAYDFQMKKDPKSIENFCNNQYLNSKSMSEIYKLRYQLTEMVNSIYSEEDPSYVCTKMDKPMSPPKAAQELFIKQVVTAGLIDQVAKIYQGATTHSLAEYRSCANNVSIFIHPSSILAKTTPEYVNYCDVIETSRPYMKLLTEVNPAWLAELGKPMCPEFKPLDAPQPKYSKKKDRVVCYVKPNYGIHAWELPMMSIDHPDPRESCRYFAKALLEGEVHNLVDKLKAGNIDTKVKLEKKWIETPQFLYKEVAVWMDESVRGEVLQSMWPPLDTAKVPEILKLPKSHSVDDDDDEE
eukprot:gene3732-4301_t